MRGVEPPRAEAHRHLKPARLPIPPHPQWFPFCNLFCKVGSQRIPILILSGLHYSVKNCCTIIESGCSFVIAQGQACVECNIYAKGGPCGVLPTVEMFGSLFSKTLKMSNTVTNPCTLLCWSTTGRARQPN